jgi:hypothetical protein
MSVPDPNLVAAKITAEAGKKVGKFVKDHAKSKFVRDLGEGAEMASKVISSGADTVFHATQGDLKSAVESGRKTVEEASKFMKK